MEDLYDYRRRHREAYEIRQREIENKMLIEKEKKSLELARKLQEEENQKERKIPDGKETRMLNSLYYSEFEGVRPPDSTYKEQLIEENESHLDNNSFEAGNFKRNTSVTKNNIGLSSSKFIRKEKNSSLVLSSEDRNINVDDSSSQNVDEEYARKLQQIEYQNFNRMHKKKEIINENEKIKGSERFPIEIASDGEVEIKEKAKEKKVNMNNCLEGKHVKSNEENFFFSSSSNCHTSDSLSSKISTTYAYKTDNVINNPNNSPENSNSSDMPNNLQIHDCFIDNNDVIHNNTFHSHAFISDDPDEAMLQAAIVQSLNDL